ncbi:hypothetical protein [Coleofasciculus sp.]|uniref:hypothetical protein n=1 Tax=Coleofasciculus sp. TaxID=3100458 RepID=UPI003A21F52D
MVRLSKERSKDPETDGIDHYIGLEHIDPDDLKISRRGLVSEEFTCCTASPPR